MKKTVFILMVTMLVVGCKKYDEGPAISLRSKVNRLVGDWKISQKFINGNEHIVSTDEIDNLLKIKKNQVFELVDPGNSTQIGEWYLDNDKNYLFLVLNPLKPQITKAEITELKKKRITLIYNDDNSDVIKLVYVQ